jgi:hypothetical protein
LLQTQQPDALAGVEYADHREKPVISDCGDYEVRLTEAFRFVNDDAIVFHLVIANRTDKAIEHAPERLEIEQPIVCSTCRLRISSARSRHTIDNWLRRVVSGGPNGRK